jgi:hypothetical protein
MTTRRFPPPWRADKILGGYVVRDANGQALAYIYSRDSEVEALQAKVLTKDEARRIAVRGADEQVRTSRGLTALNGCVCFSGERRPQAVFLKVEPRAARPSKATWIA